MEFTPIVLNPIGVVRSEIINRKDMPVFGAEGCIEIFPSYLSALMGIEEHSHLWILTWLHQADRSVLQATPKKVNRNAKLYGVFAVRTPVRPNPIALTLVKLVKIEGSILYVSGLDAIDGSPVVDVKPYFEDDTVFSPRAPYMPPLDTELLKKNLLKQALTHHGEMCSDLLVGVRMALVAQQLLGNITSPNIVLMVNGSPCLGDVLQGVCRARLANPARFVYQFRDNFRQSIWMSEDQKKMITITYQFSRDFNEVYFEELLDEEIFTINKEYN